MEKSNKNLCCEDITSSLKDGTIDYTPSLRIYGIHTKTNSVVSIYFCPWCASPLPNQLYTKIHKILDGEYGIKNPDIEEYTNIPEEFKSDAWWKKRGL